MTGQEPITHLEDEDTRHALELPDSAIAMIEEMGDFRDTWY